MHSQGLLVGGRRKRMIEIVLRGARGVIGMGVIKPQQILIQTLCLLLDEFIVRRPDQEPAPRAFLVVPMVGAFFIDFVNAVIITICLNIWT